MKLWGISVNTIKNKFYCKLCFSLKLWSQIRLLGTVYNFFIKFKGVIKPNLFIPCLVPTIIITNYAWWPWQESVLVWGCSYNTFKKFFHMKKYYRKYILSKWYFNRLKYSFYLHTTILFTVYSIKNVFIMILL